MPETAVEAEAALQRERVTSVFGPPEEWQGSTFEDVGKEGLFPVRGPGGCEVAVLEPGEGSFAARMEMLRNARTSIRIQALVFKGDESGLHRYGSGAIATVVFSHLPMWPLTGGREHEIIDDPDLLSLLHQAGVDVYVSGHHHAYYAGVDEAGMVHLSVGALSVTARAATGFEDVVPAARLPASVAGPLGTLRRVEQPVRLRP